MSTAAELLSEAGSALSASGRPEPELNAELLLEHAASRPRLHFRLNPNEEIPSDAVRRFRASLKKRATGLPLAYILGSQQFRGVNLRVSASVLIPRPETEELAGLALDFLRGLDSPVALDLCTGSGCVACALASELPSCRVVAADVSRAALRLARENAKNLGLEGRISFRCSDLFASLRGVVDCIVCNPPYVPSGEIAGLEKELSFEPALALDGGPDGLTLARKILAGAPAHLKRGGALFVELGVGQPRRLARELDTKIWDNIGIAVDLQGKERFLTARHI